MKKIRRGFTIIEVALFLAVTGLLFLGVTIGVQNSIYQQRYSDAVQSFADFMRNIYSEVMNVQHPGDGRSNEAVYGKLVTFGEGDASEQLIYTYDVVGNAVSSALLDNGSTVSLLRRVQANVLRANASGVYEPAGIVEQYMPKWGSRIQPTGRFANYTGSLLIVRSPKSGTVQTLKSDDVIKVQELATGADPAMALMTYLTGTAFAKGEVNFCINPNGNSESTNRTNVRLAEGAYNASGVEILPRDDASNVCNGSDG